MKRLRDLEGGGRLLRRARSLLAAVEPPPVSVERMRVIREAIEHEPRRARPLLPLRVALAACVGLVAVGAAAHGGARVWRAITDDEPAAVPGPAPSAIEPVRRALRAKHAEPATAREEPAEGPLPPSTEPAEDDAAERIHPSAPASARNADAALVHSAVKALRRDGDPVRASRLLDRYAARDPNGPLAEEALALRIEAALARRDPRAQGYAAQYLERYPTGRYRDVARRAQRGAP